MTKKKHIHISNNILRTFHTVAQYYLEMLKSSIKRLLEPGFNQLAQSFFFILVYQISYNPLFKELFFLIKNKLKSVWLNEITLPRLQKLLADLIAFMA